MEADLSRYYQLDYRDRWRRDGGGRPVLSLRMIRLRIRHLPAGSALSRAMGDPGWSLEHYLLADVWQAAAQSQKPHPARPAARKRVAGAPKRTGADAARRAQAVARGRARIAAARAAREARQHHSDT